MNKEYQEIRVEISQEEAYDMVDKVARFVVERHLAPAGILFLESVRPLHGIGSQFMYFVLPFAEMIFDSQKYQRFALMIENETYLKRLISRIDELDEELNRERRKEASLKRKRRRARRKEFFNKLFNKNKNAE
ncbi:MAG: hypothetical protein CVU49_06945 [Candidatus Cloacimonetes bacterium HGW-Cloacimonetes-2]|jgi:hypothetical protein|nr:MAG: hypothetical protein CVU49_06945 [Candidatus Cloacimonetes bacterium HGW-Cloacimonetes-2]